MRILRYDLTAFGSFTGLSLDLSAPGVHLVTGPNEAGKSTALHALAQLLYGIDVQSRYDFLHPKSALKLGALLQGPDGTALDIVRTKARKNPLTGPDGTPVDEALLSALLGGIDRRTFTTEFALSSAELREGGRTLVNGGGRIGDALAASRSGLVLTRAQKRIEERRRELYKPRGSTPTINVRIRELKEAQARVRDASLRPDRYLSQEREVEAARKELDQISADLTAAREKHAKLSRLEQALPALARRQSLLTDLDALVAEGRVAPEDVAERLPGLMQEIRDVVRTAADANNRIEGVAAQLEELSVDERLLAHGDEIERLAQERQAVEEAAQSLARSAGTVDALRAEAARLLAEVHPGAALADRSRYEIPESVRAHARDLDERRKAIDVALEESRQAQSRRRRKLADAERRLADLPPAAESETLRAAVAAVPADLLSRMVGAEEEELKQRTRAERIRGVLRLDVLPETLITPSREQVAAHVDALRQLKTDRREHAKRVKTVTAQLEERRLELTALLKDDPPPTADDLTAARATRDDLWSALRADITSETTGPTAYEHAAESYERAVEHADTVADRRFQGVEALAAQRQLELDIAKAERTQADLAAERRELDDRAAELDAEWTALWADYSGPVPKPDAATTTLDSVRELREALANLGDARSSFEAARGQAAEHVTRLRELLDDAASPADGNVTARLPELLEIAAARLKEHDTAATTRSVAANDADTQRLELDEADALVADTTARLTDWAQDWNQVLDEIGLSGELGAVGALAHLERLEQVAAKVAEADRIERESEQATDRIEQFHDALRRLADACDRPLPVELEERYAFVARLHTEAKNNRSAAERRDLHQQEQARLRTDLKNACDAEKRLRTELDRLRERTGVATADALDDAVRRRQRHTDLTRELAGITETIVLGAEPLEDLSAKAEQTDPDELTTRLTTLKERITDLDARKDAQQRSFASLRAEFDRLDGSAQAAQAAAEAETTAAALVEETEEYLRLEVAHAILRGYIEDYRNAHQNPVLHQAGQLFRELTLQRFSGLELDHDGAEPTVLARRADGVLLPTGDLSEGTADQLYLALRLASLERYGEEDRGLPLSLDDIFMTFDPQRTRAALKVLDGMADRFQMIVFTHHDYVAELAEEALPDGRAHVHRLPEYHPVGRTTVSENLRRPSTNDRRCRSCGTNLTYSGRGRPPVRCADCAGT